jgi:small subunit ribosomal protein S6
LYESIFILDTNTPNEQVDAFIDKLVSLIETYKGRDIKIDRIGKKRLAYEIQKRQYGYYISLEFTAEGEIVSSLEEVYRLSDEVLRYMTYKITKAQLKQRENDKKAAEVQREESNNA